jgi:hypothetical protein
MAARWSGRILALLGLAIISMFVVGEGIPKIWTASADVQVEFAGVVLMMIGLLAGWKWEWAGALLIAGGWLLLLAAERGWPPLLFTLLLVVAMLYAYAAGRRRRLLGVRP